MQVIAKSGVSFSPLQGFVFTGEFISDSYWEIDLPATDGDRVHGITQSTVDSTTAGSGLALNYFGACFVSLGENVSAGDELTSSASGAFKKRGMGDTLAGIALKSGTMGGTCTALLFQM